MNEPRAVFQGSVNRWECDENDHLNVRFYSHKMHQTLLAGLLELGMVKPEALSEAGASIKSQHMRYIAEAREAAPITGYFGVLEQSDTECKVLTELWNTARNSVMASYVQTLELTTEIQAPLIELPAHAGSRSVPEETPAFAGLSLSEALDHGFIRIGQGVIQPEECDFEGRLLSYQYMGRHSDSMPNLWASLTVNNGRNEGFVGGAVLEYRMSRMDTLKVNDVYTILSGFYELGEKTQSIIHLLFNTTTGKCVTSSQAVAITMDLKARKAIPIPEDQRAAMSQILVKPL